MPTDTDEAKLLRVTRLALGWLLIGAACGLAGCKTTEVATFSPFDTLPGTWGWRYDKELGCDSNPHVIRFSEDRTEMTITFAKPVRLSSGQTSTMKFRILAEEPHLRMLLEGERLRNPVTNRPVVRDLVMRAPDKYCWHRVDRDYGSCGRPIVRCPTD